MTLQPDTRRHQNQKIITSLNELYRASLDQPEESRQTAIENFYCLLDELPFDLLPYAAVSQFVYNNDDEDFLYFIEFLEGIINDRYSENTEHLNYKKGIKMLEHMDLAKQQKDSLFEEHEQEIQRMKNLRRSFLDQSKKIEDIQKTTKVLQEDNRKAMTNYISILGIFAAILMGAFGAIQGFSSLFENAHKLSLGMTLILSSIGASGVILILYFLLNGVSRLIGISFVSNTSNENSTIMEKHPALFLSHGFLIFIFLIGASLELSNVTIKFAWQGLWWLMPVGWFLYMIFAISTKKLFPSFDSYLNTDDTHNIEPISEDVKEIIKTDKTTTQDE